MIVVESHDPIPARSIEIWSACNNFSFLGGSVAVVAGLQTVLAAIVVAETQPIKSKHPLQRATETGAQLRAGEKSGADFGCDDGCEVEHALFWEREDGLDIVV